MDDESGGGVSKDEFSGSWHDRNWRKIIALKNFIEYNNIDLDYRKGIYQKAKDQIIRLVRGEEDIELVMTEPDSPARNAYILMWIDANKFNTSKQEIKEKYRL